MAILLVPVRRLSPRLTELTLHPPLRLATLVVAALSFPSIVRAEGTDPPPIRRKIGEAHSGVLSDKNVRERPVRSYRWSSEVDDAVAVSIESLDTDASFRVRAAGEAPAAPAQDEGNGTNARRIHLAKAKTTYVVAVAATVGDSGAILVRVERGETSLLRGSERLAAELRYGTASIDRALDHGDEARAARVRTLMGKRFASAGTDPHARESFDAALAPAQQERLTVSTRSICRERSSQQARPCTPRGQRSAAPPQCPAWMPPIRPSGPHALSWSRRGSPNQPSHLPCK